MTRRSLGLIAKAFSFCCGFGGSSGLSLPWVSTRWVREVFFLLSNPKEGGEGRRGVHPFPVLLEVTVCFMAESPF